MWIVLTVVIASLGAAPGQAPARCLHGQGESADQRDRRLAAIKYLRETNAAQARSRADRGSYAPLADLGVPAVPVGFVPRMTFDQWNYQISLKDLFDPCGFALFSDQDGIVYAGEPVRDPSTAK